MNRSFLTRVIIIFLTLVLVSCGKAAEPETIVVEEANPIVLISEHEGGILPLNDEAITTYWNLPVSESLQYLKEHCFKETKESHDGQIAQFRWTGGTAPYTLWYGTDPTLETHETVTTERDRFSPGTLYPRTIYYWKVIDSEGKESAIGTCQTDDAPRIIRARERIEMSGVRNVRDLGGYRTLDRKQIRYDMLFRGAMLIYPASENAYKSERLNDYGRQVLGKIGFRTEIDLRDDSDFGGQTEAAFSDCAYLRTTYKGYTSIFPESKYPETVFSDPRTYESLHTIFAVLADEINYPIYFHCLVGQDRTGTLAYLILGLLGVDYETITKDYELSAFSSVGSMNREKDFRFSGDGVPAGKHIENAAWQKMHEVMLKAYGTETGTLKDAVANYLMTECGITQQEIDAIRSILLTERRRRLTGSGISISNKLSLLG